MKRLLCIVLFLISCSMLFADNLDKYNISGILKLIDSCQYDILLEKLESTYRTDHTLTSLLLLTNMYLKMGKYGRYEELLRDLYDQYEIYAPYKNTPPFDATYNRLYDSYNKYKSLSLFYRSKDYHAIIKQKDNLKYGILYEEAYVLSCVMTDDKEYYEICENEERRSYNRYYCLLARKHFGTYHKSNIGNKRKLDSIINDYCYGNIDANDVMQYINACYQYLPAYRDILLKIIEHIEHKYNNIEP